MRWPGQDSLNLWPWWSCMARALEGIQQGNHLGSLKTPFNDFETHLEWSWNEDVTLRLKLLVDEGMKGGEFTQRYMFWKPMPVAIVWFPKRALFSRLRLKHSPSVVLGWARWWGSGSSNPLWNYSLYNNSGKQQTILLHIATSAQVSP